MLHLDVLAFAAHPDDVELSIGGTMCLLAKQGYTTGIVDFTRGELGSRGTPEGRLEEAAAASKVMGVSARENLGFADGDIQNTKANQLAVIRTIRRYRPHLVFLNAPEDRHPDHPAAARLTADALFYSGLRKVETFEDDGTPQEPWRPNHALHYLQALDLEPTFVVDVTDVWAQRLDALLAFKSQFHNPAYTPQPDEPQTFISNSGFLEWVEARARAWGYRVGATYGEPLIYRHGPIGVTDLLRTLDREKPWR